MSWVNSRCIPVRGVCSVSPGGELGTQFESGS